ncbi:MAG TPA: Fe-only nitrogenase accessory AnfO family protein [Desulfobacteria bacterium]|nr:Fe-only nitrogenase accessory AnfO family protein [Desulfobacteria bacterium]
MPKDIAVFLNDSGDAASLNQTGRIVIYHKEQSQWRVLRVRSFCLDKNGGLKGLRQSMVDVLKFLDACKIFVALSVVGVPYFELEKAKCSIWELDGKPEDFLDYILEEEEKTSPGQENTHNLIPLPIGVSDGCYTVSLEELQANNSGITSKQVLLPFLRKGQFYSVEVRCNHIPPWLEAEALAGSLDLQVEKLGQNELKLLIMKKSC